MKFVSSISGYLPKPFRSRAAGVTSLFAAMLFLTGISTAFATPITGTVMNLTTKKPSAGDTVALIRLQQGMQEIAHTTTDSSGHYTLDATDADQMHLVRVTHDKANYFQPVPPGTHNADVDVYNSAEKVAGVSTEADVARIEASPDGLSVIENYFVKNVSSPPRTQFGPRAYEIYLPKNAQIVSGAALGPGSMPVQSSPVPLGPPGEYTFVFPLRPGETRFQVSYRIPYSGSFRFQPRVASAVDNLAIILPKSMQFTATPATAFQPIDEDVKAQTFLAKNVTPQTKLAFQVSGTGLLPQETTAPQDGASGGTNGDQGATAEQGAMGPEASAQAAAENNNRPGIGLGVPIDTPDPLHKYKWWIVSLFVVLLAVGAGVSMKQANPATATAAAGNGTYTKSAVGGVAPTVAGVAGKASSRAASRARLLEALKEELFVLETEKLEGRIAPEEYDRQKAALEIVLKRGLERSSVSGTSVG